MRCIKITKRNPRKPEVTIIEKYLCSSYHHNPTLELDLSDLLMDFKGFEIVNVEVIEE